MNIEAAARAATDAANGTGPQAAQPRTTMAVVHRDLLAIGHAAAHAVPVLEAIATNQLIDELVAEALEALHAGGLEPVLQTVSYAGTPDALTNEIVRSLRYEEGP